MAHPPARTTICYCNFCQRATGGAQGILPIAPLADLAVTHGAPETYAHVSEGSGKQVVLHFCASCGTKLYMTYERWPDMVGLYAGTLDDPAAVTLDPAKTKQIFVASARPGTVVHAGIPAFWEHAATADGQPEPSFMLETPTAVEDLKRG
ncbi:GFA family protein [Citreicella sp. C3M06]|uniref:GFA family protein n=1 Tax=Citreicella sp. C3M06 TaxID=2841564 RepID=UPI001C085AA1|nr:GFA family protein [Citreicella sp. C3M06]MBU2962595.1 GFA family protein [Citreicella sp. C3M06]